MNVLAIEPYYGGSHQSFLDRVVRDSRHHWNLATLPARHWKWRMRSAPIAMHQAIKSALQDTQQPDVLLTSDMFDVATWLGLTCRDTTLSRWLNRVPLVTYFHENQWMYPVAPDARVDHHFGYTNLISALTSDACWFNSQFHLEGFLHHSAAFLDRMPDSGSEHDLGKIASRSCVIPPGFDPIDVRRSAREAGQPLRIGWIGRFEHDKRPDRFLQVLIELERSGTDFVLILLGERGRATTGLEPITRRFGDRIVHNGYESTRASYWNRLAQIDFVISTFDHEFFGIGICEAIWAGALPIVPDTLCYPEYVPDSLRYGSVEEAAAMIVNHSEETQRMEHNRICRGRIERFHSETVVNQIDQALDELVATKAATAP